MNEFYLMRQIPTITRARGFRLYLAKGSDCYGNRRLIDLWLNGGAAVLGHTPANLLRELKNTASRGLYAPFPHFTEGRFVKALLKIFPEHNFRIYAAPPPELAVYFSDDTAKLWRPYVDPVSPFAADDVPLFVPVLPGIQTWRNGLPFGLCVVAVNPACAEADNLLEHLPPGDVLSPILLAVAARGIYDLLASPQRARSAMPRVIKALQGSRWERHGIYLTLKDETGNKSCVTDQEWDALFQQFLEAGFLLPPNQSQPVILPGELSPGEEAKLATALISGTL